ncbi:MAG: type II toxin-antitoxin system RelE/ParE family toxin [Gammaproteobacteria bacterium]|nr:type II toxin-antitoxin system RelE/ParE family toxin [Gammaproteobacteria bacterium]
MQIRFSAVALKQLKKLDKQTAIRLINFIEHKIGQLDDPRQIGKALQGKFVKLWRYRVGDYRVIVEIQDDNFIIQVIKIGHRRDIY